LLLACKAVIPRTADQFDHFDALFEAYWLNGGREKRGILNGDSNKAMNPSVRSARSEYGDDPASGNEAGKAEEADQDNAQDTAQSGEGKLTGSLSRNIDKVDLRELMTPESLEQAERIARQLAAAMRDRRSRRRRAANRGNALNLRKIIRASISTGGDPIRLFKLRRPERPVNIVALLDVSGSMLVYSRVFLAFLKGLVCHDQKTDAYLFHTSLLRVSDVMRDTDTLRAVNRLSLMAQGFGGGTRIAQNLHRFNQQYAAHSVTARSVVIIFSDGYDTDPPELMVSALARLKRRGCRIIWLNPLKGWQDYAPVAAGMAAALPYLDLFASANTLDSLTALEPHLHAL
jgi:uncharacterized protein with von Willebrand factor type A (vWA) domain